MPTGPRPEPTALTVAIASRLRAAMASATPPVRQREVEERSGIPQSTLSRLLAAKRSMAVEQLDAICQAIGVSTSDLLEAAMRDVRDGPLATVRTLRPDVPAPALHEAAKDAYSREDENPFGDVLRIGGISPLTAGYRGFRGLACVGPNRSESVSLVSTDTG